MTSRRGQTRQRFGLAILIAIAGVTSCRHGEKLPSGDIAATLTVESIGATKFDPESLRGKPSLVLFVTPTCPHCLVTIPRAAAAAQAGGANVVAVFVAGKAQNATGVIATTKFPGAALVDDGSLAKRYGVKSVPYTLVLGPDGRARDAFVGEQDESTFRDALADAR